MNSNTITVGGSSVSRPANRVVKVFCIEAKYEFLRVLRTPGYAIPMLPLPILLYVLIGVMLVGGKGLEDPNIPIYMLGAFVVFGATFPALFGFGVGVAVDRQSGLLTLKRAQPMPSAAYLIAKILMAVACTSIVMLFLIPLATIFGHVTLDTSQIVAMIAVSWLGVFTFGAVGCFIGSIASGSAAPGIANLIFFPMIYLSGMFFPLPKVLAPWALVWPTFYLDQLVVAVGGGKNAIDAKLCVAVLVGLTVLFAGLAMRRLSRRG